MCLHSDHKSAHRQLRFLKLLPQLLTALFTEMVLLGGKAIELFTFKGTEMKDRCRVKQERKSGAREKKKEVSQQRSEEFRRAAVEKFQNRGSRSVEEVGRVLGVSSWSLYQWSKRYGKTDVMKHHRRPGDRSVQEKLKAVIEFEGLEVEKQGEYLRREGLYSEHIAGWKKSMEVGLESGGGGLTAANRSEWAADKKKIKELERDLSRKEKALAETTALLVLKKKADLIWGSGEEQ